ncbi:MAG: hypothetical protein K0S08_1686 [Gammaproteobacteria bacterium]|jgi:ribosomal protein S12 methylthiotransferase accessory factor|nr:hypothetical protein [Gammaproteobacteria bacterium]
MNLIDLSGTLRAKYPNSTLKIARSIAQKIGITRVAELTYLDDLRLPVFTCIRPLAKSVSTSLGKGLRKDLALCSAYMESIEHYFAENITPRKISNEELQKNKTLFIAPHNLPKNAIYTESSVIQHWVQGRNILSGKNCYIPHSYVSLDLTKTTNEENIFAKSSTGLASGNLEEEALIHSLCELIERNAVHNFLNSSTSSREQSLINLDTTQTSPLINLIKKITLRNSIEIFDITNDFEIPTYYCTIACNNPTRLLGKYYGSGTHPNKNIALSRAITEAAQSRLSFISGARDDILSKHYESVWHQSTTSPKIDFSKQHLDTNLDPNKSLDILIEKFAKKGITELVQITHASPEYDKISVVHALAIGLAI